MKRLLLLITALVLALAPTAPAVDLNCTGPVCSTGVYTLMSAVTTTGTVGTAVPFTLKGAQVPVRFHGFTLVWSGTTPSNLGVEIRCTMDGVNYPTGSLACAQVTMTESPYPVHIDKPGVLAVKAALVSRSNGTIDTALTVKGNSGGQ